LRWYCFGSADASIDLYRIRSEAELKKRLARKRQKQQGKNPAGILGATANPRERWVERENVRVREREG
jgi:hypothetical protein